MTNIKADQPNHVKLELDKVETVHVNFGSQKIASLCLVVKDDANSESLIDDISATGRMVITDVTPHRDDSNKADVIFRNISNDEILDFGRRMLLPPGTIANVFGEFLGDLFSDENKGHLDPSDNEKTEIPEVPTEEYDSELEPEWDNEDNPFIEEIDELNLIELISDHADELPAQPDTIYSVTVSLAEAHMAQMLHVGTNAPAFVVATRSLLEDIQKVDNPSEDDYLTVLEFPYPDTPEYFEATGSLIQSVTGTYQLNISSESMKTIRGDLISLVLRIAEGSQDALIEAFGLINPMLKSMRIVSKRTEGDRDAKPTTEDIEYCFMAEAVDRIHSLMAPSTVASIIQNKRDSGEFLQDIDTVNRLLQESGIESIFEDLLDEHTEDGISFLMPPTDESSEDDIVAYYSARVTPESFPESMRNIVGLINFPILYDNDFASGMESIKETKSNGSEIIVAKIIVAAVRFARMKTLIENTEIPLNPIGFLIQGLNYPGESLGWSFGEAVRHLALEDGGSIFFTELLSAGLPKSHNGIPQEAIMGNPVAQLLHRIGHIVLEEKWDKEVLAPFLEDKPIMNAFINDLYETTKLLEEEDEDDEVEGCAPILSTASVLLKELSFEDFVSEMGQFLVVLSELNALRSTDYDKGSKEWKSFKNDYLAGVLDIQGHE